MKAHKVCNDRTWANKIHSTAPEEQANYGFFDIFTR